MRFTWDPQKAQANLRKHGVAFEEAEEMRKEYDFSKGRKNPYAKRLKKQITIRLDVPTIAYFKAVAERTGIPYQTLINLYLRDCAAHRRRLSMEWRASA